MKKLSIRVHSVSPVDPPSERAEITAKCLKAAREARHSPNHPNLYQSSDERQVMKRGERIILGSTLLIVDLVLIFLFGPVALIAMLLTILILVATLW